MPNDQPAPNDPLLGNRMSGLLGVALGTPLPMSEVQIPDHWTPPKPEHIARLLPQYQIEHLIGRGGMGAVYKGKQIKLNRPVAIKVLPAELARSTEFIGRFQREAQLLASLNHPGIVAIFDFGQTDEGHLYFVMEYVDGTDLHRLIHRSETKLTPPQALSLTTQICEALQFAHDQGVVHRDIKPANVLVTKDFRAKLADFGLAMKPSDGKDQPTPHVPVPQGFSPLSPADPALAGLRFTRTGNVMGTPPYAAPEVYYGEADERSDIFALGIMFYEMLTGQVPEERYILPSQKVGVDHRLDEVVMKALDAEPGARFQHANEMKLAVEAASQPLPTKAATPPKAAAAAPFVPPFRPPARPAQAQPSRPPRKSPAFYLVTAAVLLAGLGWWARDSMKMMAQLKITPVAKAPSPSPMPRTDVPKSPSASSVPSTPSALSVNDPIIGRWWWPGNFIVTFRSDSTFETSYGMRGSWSVQSPRSYLVKWQNVTTDQLRLRDGNEFLEGFSSSAGAGITAYRMLSAQGPPSSTSSPVAEAGFIPLFDREHTAGWKHVGAGNITSDGSVLVTSTPAGTPDPWGLLWYPGCTFKNFVLRVEFAVDSMETNSGIFLRTPMLPDRKPDLFLEGAYEVEIKGAETGRITKVPLPGDTSFPLPIRTWNDLEITAIGQQYTVTLNGQTTATFTGNRNQSGYIALQNLGNSGSTYFRRVRIKDLGEDPGPSSKALPPKLAKLDQQFRMACDKDAEAQVEQEIAALNQSYLANGFPRAITEAMQRDATTEIAALKKERDLYLQTKVVPATDEPGLSPAVKQLRTTYRTARAKIEATQSSKEPPAEFYDSYLEALVKLKAESSPQEVPAVIAQYQRVSERAGFNTIIFNRAMPAWLPRCRGSQRLSLVRELGGSIDSENAITHALKYLKSSQNADGSWGTVSRAGTTALALLAMLGRCETPESILYGDEVMKSMMFLIELSRKKSPGYALAEQDAAYSAIEHGMVACALGEAYQSARLGSKSLPGLREAFEGAIKTTLTHQLPGGGWAGRTSGQGFRLPSEGPGMMIVTAWQAMALHTAKRSGLKFDGLQSSLDRIVDYTAGLTALDGGIGNASDPWEGMNPAKITGAGVHVYQLLGPNRQVAVKRGVQYALDHLQGLTWETAELHTLLFTAQACRHQGGKEWAEFQRRVLPVLLSKQSWNASWTNDAKLISGSTSCTTALCVLILESYYRVPGATRQ